MKICMIGKFPPIQGGVSTQTYQAAHELSRRGHKVNIVTNADEVEIGFRQYFRKEDYAKRGNELIKVHSTSSLNNKRFVPYANPYTSKLFGLATSVIEEFGCDIVIGWYLEPYGFVAGLVGLMTNTPVIIRHAGSDIGRLGQHRDLKHAYRVVLNRANTIVTNSNLVDYLVLMGARREVIELGRISKLTPEFRKKTNSLNVQEFNAVTPEWIRGCIDDKKVADDLAAINLKPWKDHPVIGIYGKVGNVKGNYDLVKALEILTRSGVQFNFIQIPCGTAASLKDYFISLLRNEALLSSTWIIPPLPPWRVPEFLSLCNITCFLERTFPITFHAPQVPREILASGSCLVVSEEITEKSVLKENLIDGKNCVIVPDPRDTKSLVSTLEKLISSPGLRRDLGTHGKYLSQAFEQELPDNYFADIVESCK